MKKFWALMALVILSAAFALAPRSAVAQYTRETGTVPKMNAAPAQTSTAAAKPVAVAMSPAVNPTGNLQTPLRLDTS
jgi:hypothetical protein